MALVVECLILVEEEERESVEERGRKERGEGIDCLAISLLCRKNIRV